jgi:hypothetical protein
MVETWVETSGVAARTAPGALVLCVLQPVAEVGACRDWPRNGSGAITPIRLSPLTLGERFLTAAGRIVGIQLGRPGKIDIRRPVKLDQPRPVMLRNARTGHATACGRASATLVVKFDAGAPLHLASIVGDSTTPMPTI